VGDIVAGLGDRLGKAQFIDSSLRLQVVKAPDGSARYIVPLGDDVHGGRISVAVLDSHSLAGSDPITWHITGEETSPCRVVTSGLAVLSHGAAGGIVACVDQIYEDFIPGARCGTDPAHVDSIVAALFETPDPNDFKKQCDSTGGDLIPDYPDCGGLPTALVAGVEANGVLTMPFTYGAIREWTKNGQKHGITRELTGRSVLTRDAGLMSGRILLPGDEFIGSSPSKTDPGNPFKPDIDVPTPRAGNELKLEGGVDKNASVLRFFPRMKVSVVCDSGAACQTFDKNPNEERAICSCGRDNPPESCTCRAAPLPEPEYFACNEASGLHRLPCTRSSHCNDSSGTACSATPLCYEAGTTWGSDPARNGGPCRRGGKCPNEDYPQCGFLLFNFATRLAEGKTAYVVDYEIDDTTSPDQAGLCKGSEEWCSNTKACAAGTGPCLGFRLQARGKRFPGDE
jgi:hypothetical protein